MPMFHLAIAVHDLEAARKFYGGLLDCRQGREAEKWIDYDFFNHQLSVHLKPEETTHVSASEVDGKQVPVRHFGIILPWDEWHALAEKLKAAHTKFIIEPYIRFQGEVGEQATMFFLDPSGNALEFKSFRDMGQVFAR